MNVREGLIGVVEAVPPLNQRAEHLGAVALHDGLERHFNKGGLEIVYPDGSSHTYGDVEPELTVQLNSAHPILRLAIDPTLAIGEGYMFHELDFEDPQNSEAVPRIDLLSRFMNDNGVFSLDRRMGRVLDHLRPRTQPNKKRFHESHIKQHYDIGNKFYQRLLSPDLTYSCAYWENGPEAMTLEEAQEAKTRHVIRKLRLEDGHKVLDIGSGWGRTLVAAAKEYDIEGLGITLSDEQLKASQELAEREGVADRIKFIKMDLLDLANLPQYHEFFDRTYSVGMFEHMGEKGANKYFGAIDYLTKPRGVTLNHFIGQQRNKPSGGFVRNHIFRGGHLHPAGNVLNIAAAHGWRDPNEESLREHYALTLSLEHGWWRNLEKNEAEIEELWDRGEIRHPSVNTAKQFIRMERFYLASSYGGFRYGQLDLFQIDWTKGIDPDSPLSRKYIYIPKAA